MGHRAQPRVACASPIRQPCEVTVKDLSENKTPSAKKRGRWIIGLFILIVAAMAYVPWRWTPYEQQWGFAVGFQSPQMATAQYTDKTVRGSLGGIPVAIPPHFAEYVEYDGDPGWGEERKGLRPVRTQESKIRNFGFTVRYPDMEGRDSPERWADYRNSKIGTRTWIRVGLSSGEDHNGPGSTDRMAGRLDLKSEYWWGNYIKLDEKEHGLDVYAVVGTDPKNNKPYREHENADDVYVQRDDAGRVEVYIVCSNREIPSAPCRHYFELEPEMYARVQIGYRRGLLSEWKQIQEGVTKTILGFAVNENN